MPAVPTPAQSAASRANGARSRAPTSAAGKAASARNGTRHVLRGGAFAHLPAEDAAAFEELHAAVTCDWGPRDAYERRWVMELVTAYWRQDRLRGLELAALTAAAGEEGPPTEATLKRLVTFARYGARIDKDIAKALQALRALRNRPDDWLDEPQKGTSEPEPASADRPLRRRAACRPRRTSPPRARPNPGRHSTATSAGHSRHCDAGPPERRAPAQRPTDEVGLRAGGPFHPASMGLVRDVAAKIPVAPSQIHLHEAFRPTPARPCGRHPRIHVRAHEWVSA